LAILPSGVIGLRAAAGSADATGIFFTTWFASGCATVTGITAAFLLSRLPRFRATEPPPAGSPPVGPLAAPGETDLEDAPALKPPSLGKPLAALFVATFLGLGVWAIVRTAAEQSAFDTVRTIMSYWTLPMIVGALVLFGWVRGVRVYESLVEGAKEGFNVAIRIIPFLVAILVGVGMFRASGGIDLISRWVGPLTRLIGMPAEALPMAILRPLTGSGALGVMTEAISVHGPDSLIGYMVSTFQGSTETTFYVLAVYFGAVGVKRTRHALPACLLADVAGILAAVFIVNLLYG
jgi:spore maturation protein SpmB